MSTVESDPAKTRASVPAPFRAGPDAGVGVGVDRRTRLGIRSGRCPCGPPRREDTLGHTVTQIAAAPFFIASALLVVSGAAKLARPDPASRALTSAGLPGRRLTARALGAVEVAIGGACLAAPGPASATAMAALYAAFALFLVRLMTVGTPVSSCGCLGAAEVPPAILHVLLNVIAASAGVLAAVAPPRALAPFAW